MNTSSIVQMHIFMYQLQIYKKLIFIPLYPTHAYFAC